MASPSCPLRGRSADESSTGAFVARPHGEENWGPLWRLGFPNHR